MSLLAGTATLCGMGCASPGSPRPPSLYLPAVVADLTATRVGDTVEIRFAAPTRSTDGLPLRETAIGVAVCRMVGGNSCEPVAELGAQMTVPVGTGSPPDFDGSVHWHDELPASLRNGPPRPIAYRVELFNKAGRTAGYSGAAATLAGAAPPPVEGLQARGSRLGVVLRWQGDPQVGAKVLLERENLADAGGGTAKPNAEPSVRHEPGRTSFRSNRQPVKAEPRGTVWLTAGPSAKLQSATAPRILDETASHDLPYRYTAVRELEVRDGDRTLTMRSLPSAPAEITLRAVYPPDPPTGLTAVGFFAAAGAGEKDAAGTFAVDLVWQPVEDSDLAGYNVYREVLGAGSSPGRRVRLNARPLPESAFHDTSASPGLRYGYAVTAVDSEGNESGVNATVLEPTSRP